MGEAWRHGVVSRLHEWPEQQRKRTCVVMVMVIEGVRAEGFETFALRRGIMNGIA
jgi:hypothetical protein